MGATDDASLTGQEAATRIQAIWRRNLVKILVVIHAKMGKNYREEGNMEHYTTDSVAKRKALRDDPTIVDRLEHFYNCFAASRSGGGSANSIPRAELLAVQLSMCRALFSDDDWNLDEARQAVEEEWGREVGAAATTMPRATFLDSMFELADIWTVEIDRDEYAGFLVALFKSVTVRRGGKRVWRKLADVRSIDASNTDPPAAAPATLPVPRSIRGPNSTCENDNAHEIRLDERSTLVLKEEAMVGSGGEVNGRDEASVSSDSPFAAFTSAHHRQAHGGSSSGGEGGRGGGSCAGAVGGGGSDVGNSGHSSSGSGSGGGGGHGGGRSLRRLSKVGSQNILITMRIQPFHAPPTKASPRVRRTRLCSVPSSSGGWGFARSMGRAQPPRLRGPGVSSELTLNPRVAPSNVMNALSTMTTMAATREELAHFPWWAAMCARVLQPRWLGRLPMPKRCV